MEPPAQPLPAPPLDPGPRWDEPGPEAGPELEAGLEAELEAELALWAAEPAAGTPPWAPPGRGGCPEDEPRLRPVFDALDRDGDGFVRVEEFVQFATAYGAEQVRTEPVPTRRGRSEGPALPALAPPAAARRPAPARGCGALSAAVQPSVNGAGGAGLGFMPALCCPAGLAGLRARVSPNPGTPSAAFSSSSSLPRSR